MRVDRGAARLPARRRRGCSSAAATWRTWWASGPRGRAARGGHGARGRRCALRRAQLVAYCSAETHTWIQKAADLSGWAPTRSAGFRWTPQRRMRRRRARGADRRGRGRRLHAVPRRGHGRHGEHGRRRSAARDRAHLPRARRCGSTSTVPTARRRSSPPGRRRDLAAHGAKPTRSPSIRTSGCTRRSKRDARSSAIRRRCRARSAITRRTTTSTAATDPPPNFYELRAAELARLPRAESVAGAPAGGPQRLCADDRRRHAPRARALRARRRASRTRGGDAGLSITTFRYVPPASTRGRRGRPTPECA